jgi:phosphate transport system substrate-binding protein
MKNRRNKTLLAIVLFAFLFAGCLGERKETPTKGRASIVVSESIEPIITMEVEMFSDLYKDARVDMRSLPARSAVVEFFNVDSIKALITSRPLNNEEKDAARRTGLSIEEYRLALDAVAVIVHKDNALAYLRTTQLDSIVTGRATTWSSVDPLLSAAPIMVCLPDQNSGEFEIVGTKILNGRKYAAAAHIAATSAEVADYVAREKRAIGFLSISWLKGNLDRVKVVELEDTGAPDSLGIKGQHFAPIQGYMYKGFYPLTTDVIVYSKADKYGVASGFISFVSSAPGQKIFLNNGLVPATMPVRIVQLSNKDISQ